MNANYMKDADAAYGVETPLEGLIDSPEEQMENIEKMMRPLTQVHPAAIMAGTVVAGEFFPQR